MRRAIPVLALAAAVAAAARAAAGPADLPLSDAAEASVEANRAFFAGDLEAAEKGYRYLSTVGIAAPDPEPNIAIVLRDQGRPDAALPAWTKASLVREPDGFIWNQRGWSYLAVGNPAEARAQFTRALDVSTTPAVQTEANIGLGMSAIWDDHPKAALPPLRQAWLQGSQSISMAAYLTGLANLRSGDKQAAVEYLGQSVDRDPLNLDGLRELARLHRRLGTNVQAWNYCQTALRLDPDDEECAETVRKVAEHLTGDPREALPVRRLSRPFLDPAGKGLPEPSKSQDRVRVALFSSDDGKPMPALRLYFVTNTGFRITARGGEVVREVPAGGLQWDIAFHEDTYEASGQVTGENVKIVEVRDTTHFLHHRDKQPFRIEPSGPHARLGSILVKSAVFKDPTAIDPGDRELRGVLEVVPTPYGFVLINELPVEDYLYGAVSAALPRAAPHEALKAQAVVSRTMVMWSKAHPEPGIFRFDLSDSARGQRYVGLNSETLQAVRAVAETEGTYLRMPDGRLAEVVEHGHCGGATEGGPALREGLEHLRGVCDAPGPAPRFENPESLERWIHGAPARDAFCEQGAFASLGRARWMRLLDARDLSRRAGKMRALGGLRSVRALERSPGGRVLALEVRGSKDTLVLRGLPSIEAFLSPGSLRSSLFTIQPLYRGGAPSHFILWGAGTGHGVGMCMAGAIGLASVGRKWNDILTHYFPALMISTPALREAKPKPAPGKRRHLNPRLKK